MYDGIKFVPAVKILIENTFNKYTQEKYSASAENDDRKYIMDALERDQVYLWDIVISDIRQKCTC